MSILFLKFTSKKLGRLTPILILNPACSSSSVQDRGLIAGRDFVSRSPHPSFGTFKSSFYFEKKKFACFDSSNCRAIKVQSSGKGRIFREPHLRSSKVLLRRSKVFFFFCDYYSRIFRLNIYFRTHYTSKLGWPLLKLLSFVQKWKVSTRWSISHVSDILREYRY